MPSRSSEAALERGLAGRSRSRAVRLPRSPAAVGQLAFLTIAVVFFLALALSTDGFLTVANFKAIVVSAAIVGILAIGQSVIMISGHLFSLSLATSAAAAGMVFMPSLRWGLLVAIVLALLAGVVMNAIQGAVIGYLQANPIIVTIAAGGLISGLALIISGNRNLYAPPGRDSYQFLTDSVAGFPVSGLLCLGLGIAVHLVLRSTRFGMQVYLMGDNWQAARAAALPVGTLTVRVFVVAGVCAAVAGMLLAAVTRNAQINIAGTNTYDAIAAALVGGVAVFGGRGTVIQAMLGALAIAAISDLALLRDYSTGVQITVKGVLVVIAVVLVRLAAPRTRTA